MHRTIFCYILLNMLDNTSLTLLFETIFCTTISIWCCIYSGLFINISVHLSDCQIKVFVFHLMFIWCFFSKACFVTIGLIKSFRSVSHFDTLKYHSISSIDFNWTVYIQLRINRNVRFQHFLYRKMEWWPFYLVHPVYGYVCMVIRRNLHYYIRYAINFWRAFSSQHFDV